MLLEVNYMVQKLDYGLLTFGLLVPYWVKRCLFLSPQERPWNAGTAEGQSRKASAVLKGKDLVLLSA